MHLKNPNNRNYYDFNSLLNAPEFQKQKFLMIMNAGMYTPSYLPTGLYIENGIKKSNLDTSSPKTDANFYKKPNGVFYIDNKGNSFIDTTEKFAKLSKGDSAKIKYATQSGPVLVINGKINTLFKENSSNLNIRNGVGIISEKKVVFAISIDKICFHDFAMFFRDIFNCKYALYLDGAISKMYLSDLNPDERGGKFGPMISVSKKK